MTERAQTPFRRHFTLILIAALGLVSVGTFVVFSNIARAGLSERRDTNQRNLRALGAALRQYASEHEVFPEELSALYPKYVKDRLMFINPSWPEEAGYLYVAGVMSDDPSDTLLLYENVPARKQKLGRQALLLGQNIVHVDDAEFHAALARQEESWKSRGRRWRLVLVTPPGP